MTVPTLAGVALALTLLAGLSGCAQPGRVPVAERSPALGGRPDSYVVTRGDTLYAIAWRFGLDHKALARANGIPAPYTIYVGQRIRLAAAGPGRTSAPPRQVPTTPRASAKASTASWRSPTGARVARPFGSGNQGIDYALLADHRVLAAAAGEVVYAGSGLGGFRHLVILKHDPAYLSAYSLDRPMAVREGQRVKAGEMLADKEKGGRRSGTLHFEIRRNGEPVDPDSLIGR